MRVLEAFQSSFFALTTRLKVPGWLSWSTISSCPSYSWRLSDAKRVSINELVSVASKLTCGTTVLVAGSYTITLSRMLPKAPTVADGQVGTAGGQPPVGAGS